MLSIAILAGGKSQRMGRDKAFLPFLGKPLIRRVMDRLADLTDDLLVVAPRTDEYLSLGLRLVPDLLPSRGSLGGLYTALSSASHMLVAVLPCDAPFVNPALLAYERDFLALTGFDAVVPSSPDGLEPLHAVYRRDACLPPIRAALDVGEQRLISWHKRVEVRVLTVAETSVFDPHGHAFININTPADLMQAEKIARDDTSKT